MGVEDGPDDNNKDATDPTVARSKYGFVKTPRKSQQEEDSADPKKSRSDFVIKHGDFSFTECPVPMRREDLMTHEDRQANFFVDIVNWSESSSTLPVEGGLSVQSNIFFESREIVLQEKNKIEYERQQESENKSRSNAAKANKGRIGKS